MSISCPHCKKRIEGAVYRYDVSMDAVRRVVLHASANDNQGVAGLDLAKTYAGVMKSKGRKVSKLSARRAIERLAKDGYLIALGRGWYRAAKRSERLARDRTR
jgi:hypothetical protein